MTTTLRLVTAGPAAVSRKRHGYTCDCEPCVIEKLKAPAVCHCDRPVTHGDPNHCVRCGHDLYRRDERPLERAA